MRRRQAEDTRRRILAAASELVHGLPSWDWSGLTFRAVAERAGVGQRTVYRHFPTERQLHDAVMGHLGEAAGVSYEEVRLRTVATVARRVFDSMASFDAGRAAPEAPGPSFAAQDDRRRRALCQAVEAGAPEWSPTQRHAAAAALDVLWSVPSYERLVGIWGLDHNAAISVIEWLIGLVVAAVDEGVPPPRARRRAGPGRDR